MFDPNPLSLSVPESEFESWLRDSGYLEIVDQRATDLHRISTTAKPSDSAAESATAKISSSGAFIVSRFLSRVWTLLSLLTFNPFSKLAATDFSGDTPPWTVAFFGSSESYSFPSSRSQARLRVHENVKRFARNYTTLFFLFFACSLYQLPLALFGLLSCLALWDAFRFSGDRWRLNGYPLLREALIRTAQCFYFIGIKLWETANCVFQVAGGIRGSGMVIMRLLPAAYSAMRAAFGKLISKYPTAPAYSILDSVNTCYNPSWYTMAAVILFISNVQFAIFCAAGVSFAVMILHASFRKLTPAKQPDQRGGQRTMARGHG